MKQFLRPLLLCLFAAKMFAAAPTNGQYVFQIFTSSGYEQVPITSVANKTLGFDGSGNLTQLTPFDGVFASLTSKPTTLAGYGITDPVVLTNGTYVNPGFISSIAWSKITSTPSTLSGYGITDAVPNTRNVNGHALNADVTVAFSELGSKPTTVSGFGISDAVTTARTINSHALSGDITITFSDLGSKPTTLSGFGITDGVTTARTINGHPLSADVSVAFADLTSKPTTLSGYGITDGVANTLTVNGHALSGNVTVAFADLGSKPTTVSSFGISDAVTTARTINSHALSADVSVSKSDVGLGSVPNTDTSNASNISSGTLAGARVQTQMSITSDGSGLKLSGDSATPGNSKVYSTDGSGTKGWHDAPGGSSLTIASGSLAGWTSYTAASLTFFMGSTDPGSTTEWTITLNGGSPQTYSFGPEDPEDGSDYIGAASGSASTDGSALHSAINSSFSGNVTVSDDGAGNITVNDNTGTMGSGSTLTVSGAASGSAAGAGPSGFNDVVTLATAVTGKTLHLVHLYAQASGISAWSGYVTVSYGDGTVIMSRHISGISDGALLLPIDAGEIHLDAAEPDSDIQAVFVEDTSVGASMQGGTLTFKIFVTAQ